MNKNNFALFVVVIALMGGMWWGFEQWLGDEGGSQPVTATVSTPVKAVDRVPAPTTQHDIVGGLDYDTTTDEGLNDGVTGDAQPHPVDPSTQATFFGYLIEFAVIFVLSGFCCVGGYNTTYRLGTIREYTPQGHYTSFAQVLFPETRYIPPPSNGTKWLATTLIMTVLLYLIVKLPIYMMFSYDTARLFSSH